MILRSLMYVTEGEKLLVESNFQVMVDENVEFMELDKKVYEVLMSYYSLNNHMPSLEYVKTKFKEKEELLYEYVIAIESKPFYTGDDLKHVLQEYKEKMKDESFNNMLIKTVKIFQEGEKVGKYLVRGREHALTYMLSNVYNLSNDTKVSGGDIRRLDTVRDRYEYKKAHPEEAYGILTGIKPIDDCFKGFSRGELDLVLGFTASGKTTFCLNVAYAAAMIQKLNVVIFSLEMPSEYLEQFMLVRHSASDMFYPHPPVIEEAVKLGKLTPAEEDFFFNVVQKDYRENPNYGTIWIEYHGSNSFRCSDLKLRLDRLSSFMPIDLVVLDYPGLMEPDMTQKYGEFGVTQNQIVKSLSQIALTYKGEGFTMLCPFQASREGNDRALKNDGVYDLRAMSYANEAERSASRVISLCFMSSTGVSELTKCACLKDRYGTKYFDPFLIWSSRQSCYMSNQLQADDREMFNSDGFEQFMN